jgi:hypothetical protein
MPQALQRQRSSSNSGFPSVLTTGLRIRMRGRSPIRRIVFLFALMVNAFLIAKAILRVSENGLL